MIKRAVTFLPEWIKTYINFVKSFLNNFAELTELEKFETSLFDWFGDSLNLLTKKQNPKLFWIKNTSRFIK